MDENKRRAVRAFSNALRDAIQHAAGVAARASDAFDGSDECVIFHKAAVAILGSIDALPDIKSAINAGSKP